jgi:hypothetical protein
MSSGIGNIILATPLLIALNFAGALGYETNYTEDNFNYSRSYFFNFLPFYHFDFRVAYPFNDKFTATYWLVNGANQSEDFNGFKSQAALLTIKPTKRITAQANYYVGQEQRVRTSTLNPTFPVLPTQPGLSPVEIHPIANGRFHTLDAYATFNATDKLTFALEGDYVINHVFRNSPPLRVTGGVALERLRKIRSMPGGNRSADLYEFFINRLRHPYELWPILTVSMINLHA